MPFRIIYTFTNKDFPKTIRLPVGVGVDGAPVSMPIQIRADQCKCRRCDGWGHVGGEPCTACDGEGIATISNKEAA